MRVQNPSDLGPWNRYIQENHQSSLLAETKNNKNYKQEITLPKVPIRRHLYTYKPNRQAKDKLNMPLKLKPIEIQFISDNAAAANNNEENKEQYVQYTDPKKSRTLSFDQPKYSHYRSFMKSHRHKDLATTKFIQKETFKNSYQQQKRQPNSVRKMSKIDLMGQTLAQHKKQEQRQKERASKASIPKQQQFSKKRSLMQLLRFLKQSNNNGNSLSLSPVVRIKELKTDRPASNLNQNEEVSKNKSVMRYQQYRNAANISLQSESKYLPYFYAKKSNISSKKK